ncbi:hypothetical protein ACFO5R_11785 [Halosolutus amylolyticus]|uniref:Uncharacterized protein n=1 Tax=Halosolutus amylolyticus TaxID=2932267 RepID=A0ABD5PQK9_9EURY|nr:hypothetical protein [Halosolutus amylolyticus]
MSERTQVREVFADVEPDPDAILEATGADSPAELIAGGGRHDPIADEAADETAVADLLGNLKDAADETGEPAADREIDDPASGRDPGSADESTDDSGSDGSIEMEITFGEPSVTVRRGDGAAIDDLLGGDPTPDRPRVAGVESAGMELVGSPTVTRVSSDAFGSP